ncbi:pentatricopeptide repeat-containing protein At2g03380, mitochondrial-like isoform X2 [Musa acuminata AAA Group]|uniref:pentatricopeptide repeat-containing protein At2g03380, mitochondrial-like isoform X2 n=1 Tax=Musa acuminata AAA Group TaxID=214697 RepID=UPI0031D7F21F
MFPDSFALLNPLRLSRCGSLDSLKKLHVLLVVTGLINDHSVVLQTIKSYLRFDQPLLALSVFETAENPTLYVQNLVIRCLSHHGFYSDLLRLYSRSQHSSRHRLGSDEFTFPFVIKACSAVSGFRAEKEVHCVVLKSGYGGHLVVQTALLHMYAKTGRMEWSRKVFDDMSGRDLISWNALISGYSSNGLDREAFEAFRQMQADGLKPNSSTFLGVIPLCRSLGPPMAGDLMHGLALKCGAFSDKALVPTLISMYAGWEDLTAARLLFDLLPSKDLVVWNAMISGYSQNGKWDEAIEVFQLMHHSDARPDIVTLVSILSSCSNLCTIDCGKCIHAIGIKHGISDQSSVVAALVSMYAKHGEIDSAEDLFHTTPEKSLLLWNPMISGYLSNGLWDMVLGAFHNMQLEGVLPDDISMINVISGCTMAKDLCRGKSAHAYSIRKGFISNIRVMNALLSLYCDCNQFSTSLELFHRMQVRSVISWNTLISGWGKIGDIQSLVASFRSMCQEGVKFDMVTVISILSSFCSVEDAASGLSFHALTIKNGCNLDLSVANALISMYMNFGDTEAGNLLFNGLSSRSIITWNALMTGYRNTNLFAEVMILFNQLRMDGQKPNSVTLLNVLPACESQLHGSAIRRGFESHTSISNCLMYMFARCGSIPTARKVFDGLEEKDSISWSVMINGYGMHGDGKAALLLFSMMKEAGWQPDDITFVSVLSACSHAGLVEQGRTFFKSMTEDHGITPRMEHYACMVDLFGRTGHLDEAYDIIKCLPFKASASLLESLLGACQSHGNAKIGEAIGKLLIEYRPSNASSYVMLSNIYAAAGQWTDYGRVRCDMEVRGVKKDAGISLVQVK